MRATLNLPPSVRLIGAALEGLVQVNRVLIETGVVPPSPLDANVRYKRESSGLEEWDNALQCIKRGWGDCEDLNSWECARINLEEDPEAICSLIRTGRKMFHCIVLMSDGSHRDVCPDLGMKVPGTSLEGIPWIETRAELVGGRQQRRPSWMPKRAYVPKSSRPTTSSTSKGGRGGSGTPYVPKSSRPPRPADPTDPTTNPTAPTATEMVSPTSAANPAADMLMPMPMEDPAFAMDEEVPEDVEEEGEEFDEEMVEEAPL